MTTKKRMWGGRFQEETDKLVQDFNASIEIDQTLALQDIQGSIAHATMLAKQNIISADEAKTIIDGLNTIQTDIEAGNFTWSVELEDVHMNIEHELTNRIGAVGGKLHTARSRNDQVATDFRLWCREENEIIASMLHELRHVLVELSEEHLGAIMPGYTHLQVAQCSHEMKNAS